MQSFLGSTSALLGVEDLDWEDEEDQAEDRVAVKPGVDDRTNRKQKATTLPPNTALMIIDVQPEYWSQCPQVSCDFPNFPERCHTLIQHYRNSSSSNITFVRANYTPKGSLWLPSFQSFPERKGTLLPTAGNDDAPLLWEHFATPIDGEQILTKPNWNVATHNDDFVQNLRDKGVDTVVMCGLITSVCVQHSAYGMFERGFNVIVATDACADRGRQRHEAALMLYGNYLWRSMTVDEICVAE